MIIIVNHNYEVIMLIIINHNHEVTMTTVEETAKKNHRNGKNCIDLQMKTIKYFPEDLFAQQM